MNLRFTMLMVLSTVVMLVAGREVSFSTAGFYELEHSGREVYNMNIGWKFHKGSLPDEVWGTDYYLMDWNYCLKRRADALIIKGNRGIGNVFL